MSEITPGQSQPNQDRPSVPRPEGLSADPPQQVHVHPRLWDWICAHYGEQAASQFGPLVSVIFAARRAADAEGAVSEEMLQWWTHLIDDARRLVDNSEKNLIEQARAAGWSEDAIARAVLLDETATVEQRHTQLHTRVRRPERPPRPQ